MKKVLSFLLAILLTLSAFPLTALPAFAEEGTEPQTPVEAPGEEPGEEPGEDPAPCETHTFGEWATVTAPTYLHAGEQMRACTVCGFAETRTAARLRLAAPRLTLTNLAAAIQLDWTAVADASAYRLYRRRLDESGEPVTGWCVLADGLGAKTLTFTDKKGVSGRRYEYTVRAYRTEADGTAWGALSPCRRGYYLLAPPFTLKNTVNGVRVTWKPVAGATSYRLYRKAGRETKWTVLADFKSGAATEYLDAKRVNGVTYTYTVKAYHNGYRGPYTARRIVYVAAPSRAAAAPGTTGMTVKWGKNARADGYFVYRRIGTGKWVKLADVKGSSAVTYLDKTARRGVTYRYCAVAYIGSARSSYYGSKAVNDKTRLPLSAKGYKIVKKNGCTYVGGVLIANKSFSLPSSYAPGGLTDGCAAAYRKMKAAASRQGMTLYICSGYRSYWTQDALYRRYCAEDGRAAADTYSARPGYSEHQTGLAIDLNDVTDNFGNSREGKWVAAHCHEYGFIIRYPKGKQKITGYMYEPWHVRYVGVKLATKLHDSGLTLEEYLGIDSVYR